MATADTALLIGSVTDWQTQTVTAPSVTVSASTGALYLDHGTTALSIFRLMAQDAAVSSVELLQNGHSKITLATPGPLTWGSATVLQAILGFAGDKTTAASHTSDNPCQLVWIPMRPEIPEHPLGITGSTNHLLDVAQTRDGTQTVVRFGGNRTNTFDFRQIPQSRFWTTSEANGEYRQFFDQVLVRGRRFQLYRDVTIDDTSSAAATYSSPLGPYQANLRQLETTLATNRAGGFESADVNFDVRIPVIEVAEYA